MNIVFSDYDFSALREPNFCCVPLGEVERSIDRVLGARSSEYFGSIRPLVFGALEAEIAPSDCEVYSYLPDDDVAPIFTEAVDSFNYFFYNRKLKRILYFWVSQRPAAIGLQSFLEAYGLDGVVALEEGSCSDDAGMHAMDL